MAFDAFELDQQTGTGVVASGGSGASVIGSISYLVNSVKPNLLICDGSSYTQGAYPILESIAQTPSNVLSQMASHNLTVTFEGMAVSTIDSLQTPKFSIVFGVWDGSTSNIYQSQGGSFTNVLNTSINYSSFTYHNGYLMASSTNGTIYYFNDAINNSFTAFNPGVVLNGIVSVGGRVFAWAKDAANIYFSTSATSGFALSNAGSYNYRVSGICHAPDLNIYGMVSRDNGECYKSMDNGASWVAVTSVPMSNCSSIAYGNGVFVVTSISSSMVYYSTDVMNTWVGVNTNMTGGINEIKFNGIFVAVGAGNKVCVSKNGKSFSLNLNAPTANTNIPNLSRVAVLSDGRFWIGGMNAPISSCSMYGIPLLAPRFTASGLTLRPYIQVY